MKTVVAVLCAGLSACHSATAPQASTNQMAAVEKAIPPADAALIARSQQLTRACNGGNHAACDAAGQIANKLESRGYCQPDADERWRNEPVCAQINGPADLMLGNVETPVS